MVHPMVAKFAFATGKFIVGYVVSELIIQGINMSVAKYKEQKAKEKLEKLHKEYGSYN